MEDYELTNRLHEIIEPVCGPVGRNYLAGYLPPFDITRETMHDSKADFLAEKVAVEAALASAEALFEGLASGMRKDADPKDPSRSIVKKLDQGAAEHLGKKKPGSMPDLIALNAGQVGFSICLLRLALEATFQLKMQKLELERQEAEYWNVTGRPPNYHARTIALRFARYVAQRTGQRPTVGKSSEGNFPSTEYARALEKIFALLEIQADFRRAGEWAIGQLTPEDFSQNAGGLLSMMGGMAVSDFEQAPGEAMGRIMKELDKGPGQ